MAESIDLVNGYFERTHAGMLLIDAVGGRILRANPAACAHFGVSREKIQGERLERILRQSGAEIASMFEQAMSGRRHCFELSHVGPDGSMRHSQMVLDPVEDGAVLLGVVQDTTDEKKVQHALRETGERLNGILQGVNAIIFTLSLPGRILYVSPTGLQRVGDVIGLRFDEVVAAEDLPACHAALARVATGGPVRMLELRLRHADGVYRWQNVTCTLYRDGDEPPYFIGVAMDLEERRRSEAALQRAVSLLSSILDSTADAIIAIDSSGKVLSFNEKLSRLWSIPEEEIALVRSDELLARLAPTTRDPEQFVRRVREIEADVEASVGDRVELADGRVLERYSQPMWRDGVPAGRVWSFRDVTARIRSEAQLVQAEKLAAMGRLVAGVAHELNNPLAAISGVAQILNLSDDAQIRADSQIIQRMCDRAGRIVGSLLSFARQPRGGRKELPPEALAESALEIMHHRLKRVVQVERLNAPDLPMIFVNEGEVLQVLVNLIDNAVQAMEGKRAGEATLGVSITFEPDAERPMVAFAITDNGTGIPPEVRPRVFEPFFTTKEVGAGTGLGLSISYGIAQSHGGTLTFESEVGCGSTFTLRLPSILPE